jgi:hypothetical protein
MIVSVPDHVDALAIADQRTVDLRCAVISRPLVYTRRMTVLEKYGLAPDPVIEYYKKDVDRSLLREHLKLTPQQRLEKVVAFMRALEELRRAPRRP